MATNINKIAELPIFLGLSRTELSAIAIETSFSMHHYKKGATITQADKCHDSLSFITQGWVELETVADDHSYRLTERIQAMHTIEPDKLFGMHRSFRSTYRALTSCEVIRIDKDNLTHLIGKYFIVRLNFLNMICRKAQQAEHIPWKASATDLKQRIAQFIKEHSYYPAGQKCLYIKMTQLANELNDSRINISNALNQLADEEKIILRRGIIDIPALQLL